AACRPDGLENRLRRLHALALLEALEPVLAPVVADRADDRPELAADGVRPVAHPLDATTHVLHLGVRRACFEHDDHVVSPLSRGREPASTRKNEGRGGARGLESSAPRAFDLPAALCVS